jgi:hypothetical protein
MYIIVKILNNNMFKNIQSRVAKIFNIMILKIKKILLIIQFYYYYDNLNYRMPQILMILYRLIHGLIGLISYIKLQCPNILLVFLENYSEIPNINNGINSAKLYMSSVLPLGITSVIPSDITSDSPLGTEPPRTKDKVSGIRNTPYVISDTPYVISGIPSSMTSSFPLDKTSSLSSGVPTNMLNTFSSNDPQVVHNHLHHHQNHVHNNPTNNPE